MASDDFSGLMVSADRARDGGGGQREVVIEAAQVSDGHHLPEGPRWHGGRLWFSDIYSGKVKTLDAEGRLETVVELDDDDPSGLGFLPDGSLLISCMRTRQIRRWCDGKLSVHADLSEYPGTFLNDMTTDAEGNSYVDSVTARYFDEEGQDHLVLVRADGSHTLAGSCDEYFPNGVATTNDGSTLLMACTFVNQIAAMDIRPDGTLSGFRFWAPTGPCLPDGICVDGDGGLWFGSINTQEFCRVVEGGEITHVVPTGDWAAIAPALGGSDGRTLYGAVSDLSGRGQGGYAKAATTWPAYASKPADRPADSTSGSAVDRAHGVVGAIVTANLPGPAGKDSTAEDSTGAP
jgi:sugar lactone lactonase YvrE